MELTHGYLLGGLLLVGVPILVHLIMRQKPRQLPFPAFRFLRQRALINRRKLRIQHWLLLALRILFVVVLVLALVQPRVASAYLPRWLLALFPSSGDRPVLAVFVFDTGYRMDYRVKSQSRLDLARQYALELHRDFPEGSQVAVLDTGEGGDEDWLTAPSQVRARLNGLHLRPVQVPLVRQIDHACRLLQATAKSPNPVTGTPPLPLLYVFSDRTRTSWDASLAREIQIDPAAANPLTATFLDLGVDEPEDVAIDSIKVEPMVAAPGETVRVSAIVRATGTSFKDFVLCHFDSDLGQPQRQRLQLGPGQSKLVTFNVKAPPRAPGAQGAYQAFAQLTVRLGTGDNRPFVDALAFNNTAHATFLVRDDPRRQGRKLLTVADDPKAARIWKTALWAYGEENPRSAFTCDVRTPAEAEKLTPQDLEGYRVVCLFQTASPPTALWDRLRAYVQGGGGLVLVPGGEEMVEKKQVAGFNEAAESHKLLPARLKEIVTVAPNRGGVSWPPGYDGPHPLLVQLRDMVRASNPDFNQPGLRPFVNRFWKVEPVEKEGVIVAYDDRDRLPALVEKTLDRGRVVQFTVVLDGRKIDRDRRWHNYWTDSSFGLVLVNLLAGYLAGDVNAQELNFPCGQPVAVPLPAGTLAGTLFKLDGPDPDLSDSEKKVQVSKEAAEVGSQPLPQAVGPGNWRLLDRQDQRIAAFSLNVRPEESMLDRLPKEDVEAVLGKDTVLEPGPHVKLTDTLRGSSSRPIELLPLLMMLVLLVLTFEGTLANRFYRPDTPAAPETAVPERSAT
jgi:hypothetical protein